MHTIRFWLVISSMLLFAFSCTTNNSISTGTQQDTSRPVETQVPNTRYSPAFKGQTRINQVKTKTSLQVEKIASGLGRPWAISPLSNGCFLITEKSGYLLLYERDGRLNKKITGLPAVDSRGQGGLLDVCHDPDFVNNKIIYWSFSEKQTDNTNLMAVAKGRLNEAAGLVQDARVIFRATPALNSTLHFGSRIIFDKDGYLFVSTGERSSLEGRKQAQWLHSGLGKIFKITKEGKPAPGNPFIGQANAMPEVYAYGIRNAQSLDIHPETGDLWEAEFGPRGGDELNLVKAGKNYGWPIITYGIEYSGGTIGDGIQQKTGMEQPIYYWDPVLSPSGMAFYKGNEIPEWNNNLFIGGLSSQHICRLVITNNKVTGEEILLADKKERFRDVAYLDGMLYAITDGGNLYCIGKKR